ncbi:MAG: helix-turn-helix transcriptional regulator [Proteobacteria bacterium]|nr:helix-turn-helix transcriptional regulator [Pseudomonadota bacterium]
MGKLDLGKYIRELRLAKGYTLAEFGSALDVHFQTVRNWEGSVHMIPADKLMAAEKLPKKLVVRKPRTGPREAVAVAKKPRKPGKATTPKKGGRG